MFRLRSKLTVLLLLLATTAWAQWSTAGTDAGTKQIDEGFNAVEADAVWVFSDGLTANSFSGAAVGTDLQAWNSVLDDLSGAPLVVASGGTSAATASGARTALGLAIGSDVQAWDDDLDDLADGTLSGSKVGTGVPAASINATDNTTGSTVALRDASGRLQAADPTTAQELVTKAYFEANASGGMLDWYVETDAWTGSTADTACDAGYHQCFGTEWYGRPHNMAKHNSNFMQAEYIWVDSDANHTSVDCTNWTTASAGSQGVALQGGAVEANYHSMWGHHSRNCDNTYPVACCQDP